MMLKLIPACLAALALAACTSMPDWAVGGKNTDLSNKAVKVDVLPTQVVTKDKAKVDPADWGSFYTYYTGETYGTKDMLTGVAEINPGEEIHPPHEHAEEEFLMVLEGEGTWTVHDKDFAAKAGDILYAAPWDLHGIKNTGDTVLKFVVFKYNTNGLPVPAQPTN